jgi:DNA-binding NarL/FixJ family response regulator
MVETGRLSSGPITWAQKDHPLGLGSAGRDFSQNETIRRLPERSREVALLLCHGQSNKQIARSLGISAYTVKDHITRLCKRLDAHNRTELVQRMLRAH